MRVVLFAVALWLGTAIPAMAVQTVTLAPGPDAQTRIQEALITIEPGGTIELLPGRYDLTDQLSLDVDNVMIRGAGKTGPNATVLSFAKQTSGSEGLIVTSDNVTLRDFAVEDTKGDAIKTKGVDRITFHNIRVEWTGGPKETNGAYGLYPVESKNVLIDGCDVIGASDAGIYVGQSDNIIVRNSVARLNVAGIEIENSTHADVYGNLATENAGGILVFDLPELPKQGGHSVRVYQNRIVKNDTPNFAPKGNIVASVPTGTGVIIMANRNVEVFDNEIADNQTVGILVSSYTREYDDANYKPIPAAIYIHDNRFGKTGWAPQGEIGQLVATLAGEPVPEIVWDGVVPLSQWFFGVPEEDRIVLANNGTARFVDLNAMVYYTVPWLHWTSTDLSLHTGTLPKIEPVTLPQPTTLASQ
jgi:parallel beta-helix repeat protein